MKFTKSQFKELMKECLSELIQEGAFDNKLEKIAESKMSMLKEDMSIKPNERGLRGGDILKNPGINTAIDVLSSNSNWANKGLFKEILKDAAQTSLPLQLREEGLASFTTPKEEEQAKVQINALSNGDPGRWARAAFSRKKRPE